MVGCARDREYEYIPGLTSRVGLLGRTSWGAWRLQAVVAAAKVPGPACA